MKTLGQLSEEEILALFLPLLESHNRQALALQAEEAEGPSLILGPGDDAAILKLTAALTVVSTDTQTQDQDFRLTWPNGMSTSGYQLGWKAATQNLADLAAMGARPSSLLVSLTLPATTPASFVTDLARGLVESCQAQGAGACSISGGDLGSGREISITVTALGQSPQPVRRSGAQVGDLLVLAGSQGKAAAGLALLQAPARPLNKALLASIRAQQEPVSPLHLGWQAAGQLHSLMDVSDGLLRDAERIARASGVSLDLETRALEPWLEELIIPASSLAGPGQQARDLALNWVLTGGEDHGLLGTCSPGQIPAGFTSIGKVGPGSGVTVDGQVYRSKGWDHFESASS